MVTTTSRPTVNLLGLRTKWSKQPARLRTLTWDDLKELAGTPKIQVINDFRRHGIMLEVRLIPAQLGARVEAEALPGVLANGLPFAVPNEQSFLAPEPGDEYEDETLTLTADWQKVTALVGFWLRDQTFRHPLLGAAFTEERYVRRVRPDGENDWKLDLVRIPRVELLQFRGPGDVTGGQPATASGVVLPGFLRQGERPPPGATLTWDDADAAAEDDTDAYIVPDPDLEAEQEAAAQAALEPSAEEINAHIRRRRGGG